MWARRKIEEARRDSPALIAEEGRALQVWGTIGTCGYVTVDGDIYLEEDVWDPRTGDPKPLTFAVRSDEGARRQVLLFASQQHPELAACLPVRAPDDPTCGDCLGSGWRMFGEHRIFCEECGGLGWLAADRKGGAA
jgi:hypothetical protein